VKFGLYSTAPQISEIVDAGSEACKEQDCVLTGGETSIQPGVLERGS
jgi:phosphoribosylaminoimidazole (AIR) synthetase